MEAETVGRLGALELIVSQVIERQCRATPDPEAAIAEWRRLILGAADHLQADERATTKSEAATETSAAFIVALRDFAGRLTL